MNARNIAAALSLFVLATACEFGEKSIGGEIAAMGSSSGDDGGDGASGNMSGSGNASTSATTGAMTTGGGPTTGSSTDDSDGDPDGGSDPAGTEDTTGDAPDPVGPDCDLGEYLDSVQLGNYICGYTPYTENLQLTHDCILEWDGWLAALWLRPEQPIAEAIVVQPNETGRQIDWFEHESGTITTWTCADFVETPDCTVGPTDMCITCVDPGAPAVVCSPP